MTVRTLIRRTLTLIGVIGEGETPSAEMQADGLSSLKDMLESWSTESLSVYTSVREQFTLVASQAAYTWGATGNFNSARPVEIEFASILAGGVEYPVQILNLEQWSSIAQKTATSDLPGFLYFETSFPLGQVNLYPVPSTAVVLVVNSKKPLTNFASVNEEVSFPPGYARAIRYNLAIELADEYGRQIGAGIGMIAAKSLGAIKKKNSKPRYLTPDHIPGQSRGFNIYTGE